MNNKRPKGYVHRPLEVAILPLVFIFAPLINLAGWGLMDLFSAAPLGFGDIARLNYGDFSRGSWDTLRGSLILAVYLFGLATALGVWKVRPWGFWMAAFYGMVAWFSSSWSFVLVQSTGVVNQPVFTPFQPSALVNLVFFVPVLILLQRDLVKPFFQSHLRWWEQNKRIKVGLPLRVDVEGSGVKELVTFDLSLHGCFVAGVQDLPEGKELAGEIILPGRKDPVKVGVKAHWATQGSQHYPAGQGCAFRHLSKDDQEALESFIKGKMKEGHKPLVRPAN